MHAVLKGGSYRSAVENNLIKIHYREGFITINTSYLCDPIYACLFTASLYAILTLFMHVSEVYVKLQEDKTDKAMLKVKFYQCYTM